MLQLKEDKILETSRLLIEPLLADHAAHMFDVLQDVGMYEFLSENPPNSIEQLKERYSMLAKRRSPSLRELWLNWALRLKDENLYIGTVQATVYEDGTANIACVIASQYWHRGLAFEACSRMIAYLFDEYEITVAKADTNSRNKSSQRLLNALGFIQVRTEISTGDYFYQLNNPRMNKE